MGDSRITPLVSNLNTRWNSRWRSRLRHCAISRKVAGSIPVGATGIFFVEIILPAALWPLTEMSTRNISWEVKAVGALG